MTFVPTSSAVATATAEDSTDTAPSPVIVSADSPASPPSVRDRESGEAVTEPSPFAIWKSTAIAPV